MSNDSFYQGSPNGTGLDVQNPTLVPNTYDSYANNGTLTPQSPATVVFNNPRVAGTLTITVGGTKHTGDVLHVTVTNGTFKAPVAVSYTVLSGDTLESAAEALAALLTANSVLQQHDIYATSYQGVITFNQLGPVSAFTTVTESVTGGGATTTLTVSNSGVPSGGTGPAIGLNNANATIGAGQIIKIRYGMPLFLGYPELQSVVQNGLAVK